jgi:hypothetical protein
LISDTDWNICVAKSGYRASNGPVLLAGDVYVLTDEDESVTLAAMAGARSMLFPNGEELSARITDRPDAKRGGLFERVEQGAMSARHLSGRGRSKKLLRYRRGSPQSQISI